MSELRSAVDSMVNALSSTEVAELPDALVEEDFSELMRAEQLIELWQSRYLLQLDRRRSFEREGHLSLVSWLADRFRLAWGLANRRVKVARALDDMPEAREAAESGEISLSQVDLLAAAHDAEPEAFGDAEAALVDAARLHTVSGVRRVVGHWREAVDRTTPEADREAKLRQRRRLHASPSFEGMVRMDGDLDPEGGESVLSALHAYLDAESRSGEDDRTPAQHRADALGDICRQWLDRSDRPDVAGERPHVTVTIDATVLVQAARAESGDGRLAPNREPVRAEPNESAAAVTNAAAELDHLGPVSRRLAVRLACDASLTRVVMGPASEPLDVGRRTPVVPPAIRRAVVVRDRHCRFPGCAGKADWNEIHHLQWWDNGGSTNLDNLIGICPYHHLVHEGGWRLEGTATNLTVKLPDGTLFRGPP
jgi:hypothetical protein